MFVYDPRAVEPAPSWQASAVPPAAPAVSPELAHSTDLLPTILGYALDTPGAQSCPPSKVGTACDGRDLRPYLLHTATNDPATALPRPPRRCGTRCAGIIPSAPLRPPASGTSSRVRAASAGASTRPSRHAPARPIARPDSSASVVTARSTRRSAAAPPRNAPRVPSAWAAGAASGRRASTPASREFGARAVSLQDAGWNGPCSGAGARARCAIRGARVASTA
jgi:hypothetical protein